MKKTTSEKREFAGRPRIYLTEQNAIKLIEVLEFHQISIQDLTTALIEDFLDTITIRNKLVKQIKSTNISDILPSLQTKLKKN